MLLVLGQNWDHVLLCKEVKGTGFVWHGVFANQNGSLCPVHYSVYIMSIEPLYFRRALCRTRKTVENAKVIWLSEDNLRHF